MPVIQRTRVKGVRSNVKLVVHVNELNNDLMKHKNSAEMKTVKTVKID